MVVNRITRGVVLPSIAAMTLATALVATASPAGAVDDVFDYPAKVRLKVGQSVVAGLPYMGNDWTPKVTIAQGPKKVVKVRAGGLPPGAYVSFTAAARKAGKAVVTFTESNTGTKKKMTIVVK
jgi:hypothetical protein